MTTTFFSFDLTENAQKFVGAVMDQGAKPADISVVAQHAPLSEKGDPTEITLSAETGISTTTAADAGAGAVAGASLGLAAGIAAGLAAIFIPGIGLVIGGGALATAIAGAAATAAGGAVAGGVTGYLKDLGMEGNVPEDFEKDYLGGHVIVGITHRLEGITPEALDLLARKYHASRSTLGTPPMGLDSLSVTPLATPVSLPSAETLARNEAVIAQDIMTASPVCCQRTTGLQEVARMMAEHDCGAIPVIDTTYGEQVVGMITDRDIVTRAVAENRNPLLLMAEDCMTAAIVCVRDNDNLAEICRVMESRQVRRVPVLDMNSKVVGIIAQADLARKGPYGVSAEVLREVSQPTQTVALV